MPSSPILAYPSVTKSLHDLQYATNISNIPLHAGPNGRAAESQEMVERCITYVAAPSYISRGVILKKTSPKFGRFDMAVAKKTTNPMQATINPFESSGVSRGFAGISLRPAGTLFEYQSVGQAQSHVYDLDILIEHIADMINSNMVRILSHYVKSSTQRTTAKIRCYH
ncbi:hypothetical protein FRC06_009807 [Ceratobasidium sp. 370]|nr:hypothetical protein FRC06_009807 [Ceratobasidium sp. 370]